MKTQRTLQTQADEGDNPRYLLSLRMWHPRLSAGEVQERMGMEADRAVSVGEPRTTPRGRPLPGLFRETYCAFRLEHPAGLSPD